VDPTRAVVEETLAELGLQVPITMVPVPDAATAQRLAFLGSPTVRVDGLDVDPAARTMSGWSMACRGSTPARGYHRIPAQIYGRQSHLGGRRTSAQDVKSPVATAGPAQA
jgi:hypothetical protein